jgi:hypothetical protein
MSQKMSICYYEQNNNKCNKSPRRRREKYRFVDIKTINFDVSFTTLLEATKNILACICRGSVFGYLQRRDKYWCKIYDNNKICILHIELGLDKTDTDQTSINFIPIFGTDKIIQKFVFNFVESIKRYTTSSFIRGSLNEISRL